MKLCPKCQLNKDDKDFYVRPDRDGQLSGYCKVCTNIQSTIRVTKSRQDLKIGAIELMGGKCSLCNFDKSIWALAFHHLESKDNIIPNIKNKIDLEKELLKCILVCFNCHMEIHEGLHPSILLYSPKLTGQTLTRRKHKNDYVQYKGGQCLDCFYSKCNRALNFHHEHDKDFAIGSKSQLPKLIKVRDELDKCILLCANCHQMRHERERTQL